MHNFLFFATVFNAFGLPLLGLGTLLAIKLTTGTAARRAERRFLAVLVVVTVVTARTVTTSDATWLIHTLTLSTMIVGALSIPGQNTSSFASQ